MVPNCQKMSLMPLSTRTLPRSFQTEPRFSFAQTVHQKRSSWGILKSSSSLFWKQGLLKLANRWKLFVKELRLFCKVIARFLATWAGKVLRLVHVAKRSLTQRSSDRSRPSRIVLTIIQLLAVFGEPLSLSAKFKKPSTLNLLGAEPDSPSTVQSWITSTKWDW